MTKKLSNILNVDDFPEERRKTGGLVIERSSCCNAPIKYTTGLVIAYCSKCKKNIEPQVYK